MVDKNVLRQPERSGADAEHGVKGSMCGELKRNTNSSSSAAGWLSDPIAANDEASQHRQLQRDVWSTWSTGPYTFSKYKVLWKEMSGSRFCAGYIGPFNDPVLGRKVVVPDHKLYFVPVSTLNEARYLTGILNAPAIATAIAGYAAQLSLGTSVIENLTIPEFDPEDDRHTEITRIAGAITDRSSGATPSEFARLNQLAHEVVSEHGN
jgi:hypothetical protein